MSSALLAQLELLNQLATESKFYIAQGPLKYLKW